MRYISEFFQPIARFVICIFQTLLRFIFTLWQGLARIGLFARENKTLIVFIFGFTTFVYHNYANNSGAIHNDFNQLITQSRLVTNRYEDVYNFCAANTAQFTKPLPKDSRNELLSLSIVLNTQLANLNNQRSKLGSYISPKTHHTIHELACWTNYLISQQTRFCYANLKDTTQMDLWRNQVIQQIVKNQRQHQHLFKSLHDYAAYLLSYPRDYKYPYTVCDLKQARQDTLFHAS
ncbi:MAG: hypothetical protein AAGG80_06090 [Pseudomonadota bacterium]